MATLHWTGAASTDLNNPANFVTDGANGTSAASAFSSSDPTNDDIVIQSVALSNVTQNPTVNANVTFKSLLQDAGSTLTGNASYSISISSRDGTTGKSVDMNGATSGEVNIIIINNLDNDLDLGDDKIHDLTINNDTAARKNYLAANTAITGDLIITRGIFNTFNREFEADGDCSIAADGTLDANTNGGQALTLGTLEIADGGTFIATSGTTTITENSNGGNVWQNLETDGTGFVHNNGTVYIKGLDNYNGNVVLYENTFYNLTVNMNSSSNNCYWNDISGGAMEILGDLTIIKGEWEKQVSGDTLTIHGNTYVEADGFFHTDSHTHTGQITHHGLVTNSGTYKTAAGDKNALNGGIRNLGTFTSDDTVTIGGTGGILEGNLDDAIIDVNLDSAFYVSDSDTDYATGSYVETPMTSSHSISLWIKPNDGQPAAESRILGIKGDTWAQNHAMIALQTDGKIGYTYKSNNNISGAYTNAAVFSDGALTGWTHVCVTANHATGGAGGLILYINGIAQTLQSGSTANGNTSSVTFADWDGDSATTFYLGTQNADSTVDYGGYIADAKVFTDVLSQSEVAQLASKINCDPDTFGIDNLFSWHKCNEGTSTSIVDHQDSGSDYDLTITNPLASSGNWKFDAFYVDVYDNSTTTDGTFTITKGKVEGLSLTSFNADSKYAQFTDTAIISGLAKMSLGVWFKCTGGSGDRVIVQKDTEYRIAINSSNYLEAYIYDSGGSAQTVTHSVDMEDSKWHHATIVWDGSQHLLYVDGILSGTNAGGTAAVNNNSTTLSIALDYGTSNFMVGNIRDFKIFDYALSADQISSLYSGSYNVTPSVWYPMNDDTETTTATIVNEGTGGSITCAAENAGYTNGILDLDGALTIAANGSLSAPRGALELTGNLDFNCTSIATQFLHNNGQFHFEPRATSMNIDAGGATFYEIHRVDGDNEWVYQRENCTVLNRMYLNDYVAWGVHSASTLTLGDADTQCTVDGSQYIQITAANGKVYGGDPRKPALIQCNSGLQFGANTNLKWLDIQVTEATGGGGHTITLDGEMEFDAFTVTAGDTFDINGERAEFSGILSIAGTLDSTGGGLIVGHNSIQMPGGAEEIHDGDLDIIVDGGTGHDWRLGTSVGNAGGPWCTNAFINGNITHHDQMGPSSGSSNYNPQNVIVGTGKLTQSGGHAYLKDLTIGYGGEFEPTQGDDSTGQRDIDLYGDFTTSGGIIGTSAMTTSGDSDYEGLRVGDNVVWGGFDDDSGLTDVTNVFMNSKTPWDFTGDAGLTIECWIKLDDLNTGSGGVSRGLIAGEVRGRNDGTGNLYGCGMQIIPVSGTDYVTGIAGSNDGTWDDNCRFPLSDLTAGKWHHLAFTADNNNSSTPTGKLYLDGKLKAQHTGASAIYFGYYFCVGGFAYNTHNQDWTSRLDAAFGRMSIWNVELTQKQILQMMFEDHAAATASSTPHGNCRVWYQFDEGTGMTVDNKGVGGSTYDGKLSTAFGNDTCDTNHTSGLSDGSSTNVRHITHDADARIVAGLKVIGAGIPSGATVASVNNSTCFTLSADPTATNSNTSLHFRPADATSWAEGRGTGWAPAGTLTYSTSTLKFVKSGTAIFNFLNDEDIYNLTLETSNTLSLNCLDNTGGRLDIYGTLDMSGTKITTGAASGNSTIGFKAGGKTLILDNPSTALADLYRVSMLHDSGTITVPACTVKRLVHSGNGTTELSGAMTLDTGHLQIQAGVFDTASNTLTVAGQCSATGGSLLLRNSTASFGLVMAIGNSGSVTCANTNLTTHSFSLGQGSFTAPSASGSFIINNETSHLAFDYDGNGFVHNSGTIDIRTEAETLIDFTPNDAAHLDINNVTINHADCIAKLPSAASIAGHLKITAGKFDCDGNDLTTKSITIGNGAEFKGSTGTTTIDGEGDGSNGTNGYAWYNVSGTYTHNNGTVKFTGDSDTDIREDAFYNVIINGDTSSVDYYIRQKDGESSSSGHIKIFNNLDIQRGGFSRAKPANELTVFGILDICSGGTGGYFGDTSDTGIYNLGAVNIHNNGTLKLSNGANNINSIRNIGGAVAQD